MALDPSSMVMKLDPIKGLDLTGFQEAVEHQQRMKMQREQLRLQREQFAAQQKRHEEDLEMRRIAEANAMARARMEAEREKAKAEAEAAAKALEGRQGQSVEFAKHLGKGEIQEAEALIPTMVGGHGMGVELEGTVDGLPRYRISMDAKADAAEKARLAEEQAATEDAAWQGAPRPIYDSLDGSQPEESAVQSLAAMEQLGYPTNERGNLDDTSLESASTLTAEGEPVDVGVGQDPLDPSVEDALMPGEGDFVYTPTPYAPPGGGAYGSMEEGAGHDMPEEPPAEVSVGATEPLGVAMLSGQDPFARALASRRQFEQTGRPTRGRDQADATGSVPTDVIDTGAMQMQTLQRLNPALAARANALPAGRLRRAAKANAEAIGGLGFGTADALKEMDAAMKGPLSLYANDQKLKAEEAKDTNLTRREVAQFRKDGETYAREFSKAREVDVVLNSLSKAREVTRVLDNINKEDDGMVAAAVMDAQNVVGAPSNTDLELAFKIPKGSLFTKGIAIIQEAVRGGMSDAQKEAIRSYMAEVSRSGNMRLEQYLDDAYASIDSGDMDPEEAVGFKRFTERSVPASVLNPYLEKLSGKSKGAPTGGETSQRPAPAPGAAGAELQRQAESAGLNGQVLGQLMGGESGGRTDAANEDRTDGGPKSSAKGVFQLTNETAKRMGFKDSADYAAQPLEKQIEVGLKLFKNKGITKDSPPEDYALVLAAPSLVGKWKSRDDVVYKKGSIEWEGNAPWRPAGGGDITVGSITDYYVKGEGREISRARGPQEDEEDSAAPATPPVVERLAPGPKPVAGAAPPEKAKAQSTLALPEPQTPEEKRIVELLRKQQE